MNKEYRFETPEEKEEYEQALAEFINSDEFLEQKWVQELKSISERNKTLVLDPFKANAMVKAEKLLREIFDREFLDAEIVAELEQLTHTDGAIRVYVDSFSAARARKTMEKYMDLLSLADTILVLPAKNDQVFIELGFTNLMLEA